MDLKGEQSIAAPRDTVWAALNDPDVLRRCIPGCQSLEKIADDRMRAIVAVKVGPIGARFTGEVVLSDLDPPNGYRIEGEGQGGQAGFAKGGALVRLRDDGGGTRLTYEASAQVGGKLAQLGGAIIDATAKQMAAAFFKRLSVEAAPAPAVVPANTDAEPSCQVSAATVGAGAAPASSAPASVPPDLPRASGMPVAWVLAVALAALAGVLVGGGGAAVATSGWVGLSIGLLIIIVAGAAFEFGRRSGGTAQAPVIVLDAALLERLRASDKDPKP
jgi:carbon monoxide dehydrogenase subunit G